MTDAVLAHVEDLHARLAEACTLLQDCYPKTTDPGLRLAWGRRRKALVNACIDDRIWPVQPTGDPTP